MITTSASHAHGALVAVDPGAPVDPGQCNASHNHAPAHPPGPTVTSLRLGLAHRAMAHILERVASQLHCGTARRMRLREESPGVCAPGRSCKSHRAILGLTLGPPVPVYYLSLLRLFLRPETWNQTPEACTNFPQRSNHKDAFGCERKNTRRVVLVTSVAVVLRRKVTGSHL